MMNKECQYIESTCICVLSRVAHKSLPIQESSQEDTELNFKQLYFGNSQTVSVKYDAEVSIYVGQSCSTKKFIEENIKDMPNGT